jgi:hypothetical protein
MTELTADGQRIPVGKHSWLSIAFYKPLSCEALVLLPSRFQLRGPTYDELFEQACLGSASASVRLKH